MSVNFNLSLLDAPIVTGFQGRQSEIAALRECARDPGCSMTVIVGMGGMGKSWLARSFVDEAGEDFTSTSWLSLLNAPSWLDTLNNIIRSIDPTIPLDFATPNDALGALHNLLTASARLIVFDNFETLMDAGRRAHGALRGEHAGYEQLLRLLAMHPSCLTLVTTRERPALLDAVGDSGRTISLGGLAPHEAEHLAVRRDLMGSPAEWDQLVNLYGGNPQLLKLAAGSIQALGGSIVSFLEARRGHSVAEHDLFDWHFQRLTPREQSLLYWLAVARTPTKVADLVSRFYPTLRPDEPGPVAILTALRSREIVEWAPPDVVALQPALLDFVTAKLVAQLSDEIVDLRLDESSLLAQQAGLLASAPAAVVSSQRQLVLDPVLERIADAVGSSSSVGDHLRRCVQCFREHRSMRRSYAVGTLLNLLIRLEGEVTGLDLSGCTIRSAHLADCAITDSSFANSELMDSEIAQTFGNILAVAASPDGQWFGAAGTDNDVRVWHASGEQHAVFAGHTNWVRSLEFNTSSTVLASGSSDGTLRLWNVGAALATRTIVAHEMRIWAIAWVDDRIITASQDKTLKLWDSISGVGLATLEGHTSRVLAVARVPGRAQVVSGSADESLRVWDLDGAREIHRLTVGDEVVSVAVAPDGNRVAVGAANGSVCVFDLVDGHLSAAFSFDTAGSSANCVRFHPDGQLLLSAHDDGGILVWDLEARALLTRLPGHTSRSTSLAIGAHQDLISGGEDRTVRRWNTTRWELSDVLVGRANHAWSVDIAEAAGEPSRLVTSHEDGVLRVWSPDAEAVWKITHELRGHANRVWCVRASRDGRFAVSASEDGHAKVWDLSRGLPIVTSEHHASAVWAADFSQNGSMFVTGTDDGFVRAWETSSGRLLHEAQGHGARIRAIAGHPLRPQVASGAEDFDIHIWDLATGALLRTLSGHSDRINALSFNHDGTVLVSASRDDTAVVWDFESGRKVASMNMGEYVWAVACHPTEKEIAVGVESGRLLLQRWADGGEVLLSMLPHRVKSLKYSRDGSVLAGCSEDGSIRVFDTAAQSQQTELRAPRVYEGLDITGLSGPTEAAIATVRALGAEIRNAPIGDRRHDLEAGSATVFISYGRVDVGYARRLASHLAASGIDVWFDQHGIDHGDAFAESIERALQACSAVVVLMSSESAQSRWVKREIQYAESLGKPLLPMLLDGTVFFQLSDLHHEDARGGVLPSSQFISRLRALTTENPSHA